MTVRPNRLKSMGQIAYERNAEVWSRLPSVEWALLTAQAQDGWEAVALAVTAELIERTHMPLSVKP